MIVAVPLNMGLVRLLLTYAVVASWVLLSEVVGVGPDTVPVNVAPAKAAYALIVAVVR